MSNTLKLAYVRTEIITSFECPVCECFHQRSFEVGLPADEHIICPGQQGRSCRGHVRFKIAYDGASYINVQITEGEQPKSLAEVLAEGFKGGLG